ncbi:MAG: lysylphosphatidylglycerol synthase transmembrane domain-containing protein [Solirubrobacterales bacterium]
MLSPATISAPTPPLADGSFTHFFDAVGEFFDQISAIHWGPLVIALACQGAWLTIRTRAWFNGLRAAYPAENFPWRNIWAAEVAGNGISSVIPAHAGVFVRLYLGKHTVRGSNYATVGSSCMVELPFDLVVGLLILIYGFTQGVFPKLPDLSKLNAFDLSFFAQHPKFAVFFVTLVPILLLMLFAYASVRVRDFWANVRQGVTMLRSRELYFRGAVGPQALAWVFRFTGLWMMLKAFNLPTGVDMVLTVIAVQVAASLIPLTPQGAGVQQALLYSALAGVAAGPAIAAYSVGQQLALAVFNAAFGLVALAFVFRTTDWRALMRAGKAEKAAEEAGGEAQPAAPTPYQHDNFGDDTWESKHPDPESQSTLEYPEELPEVPRDY